MSCSKNQDNINL